MVAVRACLCNVMVIGKLYLESLACTFSLVLDTLKFTTIRLRMNIIHNNSRSYLE